MSCLVTLLGQCYSFINHLISVDWNKSKDCFGAKGIQSGQGHSLHPRNLRHEGYGEILSRLSELTPTADVSTLVSGLRVLLSWASRSPRGCGGWRTQHGEHTLGHGQCQRTRDTLLPAQTTHVTFSAHSVLNPIIYTHLSFPAWMINQALKTVSSSSQATQKPIYIYIFTVLRSSFLYLSSP